MTHNPPVDPARTAAAAAAAAALQGLLEREGLDALHVPGSDQWLNEYVPAEDNRRLLATGFTGSAGEVLVTKDGVRLYVDGRYHEQADLECGGGPVRVVKVPMGTSNMKALRRDLEDSGAASLGVEADRVPLSLLEDLGRTWRVRPVRLPLPSPPDDAPVPGRVRLHPGRFAGPGWRAKARALLKEGEACFTGSPDAVSWLLNLRGHQFPNQAVARAKALASRDAAVLLVPAGSEVEDAVGRAFNVARFGGGDAYEDVLRGALADLPAETLLFDPRAVTALDGGVIREVLGERARAFGGLLPHQSAKSPAEVRSMESSFDKASEAIFRTLSWAKSAAAGGTVSEASLRERTDLEYRRQGALSQSFPTISGISENAAFIHYGDPKPDRFLGPGDTALLDSGGIFEEGFATDCTRTFLGHGEPSDKRRLLYTLVLKGLLRVHNTPFERGTPGKEVDAVARGPVRERGFDYAHGTGHGVGINVHEGGYSLVPGSDVPIEPGKVGSIEPGIYVPGFMGVRLEDVAVVEEHPKIKDRLRFRNLVFVGFDHDLIDPSLLTNEEKGWLDAYERECAKRGRSFLMNG